MDDRDFLSFLPHPVSDMSRERRHGRVWFAVVVVLLLIATVALFSCADPAFATARVVP